MVLNSDKPVLVDFGQLGVVLAECLVQCRRTHNDYEGKAVVGKVDVDNNQQIAMQYGIRNIPTVLIFKNGEVVDKFVGVVWKRQSQKN